MENRINRKDVSFSTAQELDKEDREYWAKATVEEKFRTITYLRECFYGPEATTGRLQRVYHLLNKNNLSDSRYKRELKRITGTSARHNKKKIGEPVDILF